MRLHPLLLATAPPLVAGALTAGQGAPRPRACAPPAAASAESLAAAGRWWHALRAAPPLPPGRRPVAPDVAALQIRILEGVGDYGRITAVLGRVPGADTVPELLAAAARQDERGGRWAAAASRYRRLAALPGAAPVLRAVAAARLAVVTEQRGGSDAAAAWQQAVRELPALADWLALRLAASRSDTAAAVAAVAAATTPGAARAADSLLARRREGAGDLAGALAIQIRSGRALDAARLELALGETATGRALADSVLLADPTRPEAVSAAQFVAARVSRPTAAELDGIALVWAARGRLRVAERWAARAVHPRDTSLTPVLTLAAVQSRGGRTRAALATLDAAARLHRGAPEPAGLARQRVQVLAAAGRWTEAAARAAALARAAPGDSDAAAALFLLAQHARAAGDLALERALDRTLLDRFPGTGAARGARLQLALADVVAGHADSAAALLAVLPADSTARDLRPQRYWLGRIRLERHEAGAAAGLAALAAEVPTDFYGVRARELLGDSLALRPDSAPAAPAAAYPASRARERVILLARMGFEDEARAEAMGWLQAPGGSPALLVEVAGAAAAAGFGREAILLAEAARRRLGLTPAVARALYPYPYREVIEAEAAEQCVDPLLMAAIVRQESRFDPRALSRAGARGISQVLPVTGAELSRRLRLGPWRPRDLYLPDFNLHLGATYVSDRERRDSLSVYSLIASYIAGRGGVLRWRGRPDFHDVDLFVERLSAGGIRDYVRNVYANYAWYRRLYGTAAPPR